MKKYLLIMVLAMLLGLLSVNVVSAQGDGTVHYVRFGDTLYSIADQYGVSAQAIMGHNGLANPDLIYIGQPLVIPGGFAPNEAGNYGNSTSGCTSYHAIVAGETLSDIAYRNGVSMQTLMQQNSIYNSDLIYVGQKICVLLGGGYTSQPANYQPSYAAPTYGYYHVVTYGETLYVIASQYNVSYLAIMQANNINTAGFIMAGQKLYIPGHHAPAVAPAPLPSTGGPVYKEHYSYSEGTAPVSAHTYAAPEYGGHAGEADSGQVPLAPEHQVEPELPILPEADHPIEVLVNGGPIWVADSSDIIPDPDGLSTLIVQTADQYDLQVRIRSGDYEVKGFSDDIFMGQYGAYRFVFRHIPAGDYDVWLDDPQQMSEVHKIHINPGDRAEIKFKAGRAGFSGPTYASPGGWVLAHWDNPSEPGLNLGSWSNILVNTPAPGLWVKIESEGGGYQASCLTGTKGVGSCDFAGLSVGIYRFWIDGTDLVVKTYMDGAAYATFDLARQPSPSDDANAVGPIDYSNYSK